MSVLKDLVSAQSCGTGNSISQMAASVTDQAKTLSSINQFAGPGGPVMQNQNDMMASMMNMNNMNNMNMGLKEFHPLPVPLDRPLMMAPSHPMSSHPISAGPIGPGPLSDPNVMANEFQKLQVNSNNFEALWNQPLHHGPPPSQAQAHAHLNWENEFMNQQKFFQNQNLNTNSNNNIYSNYNQMQMRPYGHMGHFQQFLNPSPYRSMNNMNMNMPIMTQNLLQPNTLVNPSLNKESLVNGKDEVEVKAQTSNVNPDPAVKEIEFDPNKFVNSNNLNSNTTEQGGVGGMGREMIDQFKNSDNPKFKNSKFLKFIQQFNDGEIEFVDNSIKQVDPQVAKAKRELAEAMRLAEQDERDEQAEDAYHSFVNNFNNDPNHQTQWSQGKNWADEFAEGEGDLFGHGEEVDYEKAYGAEYGEMNVASKIAEAQAALNADPVYTKSNVENPFANNKMAFEEGKRLLAEGKLKPAIQAFEAVITNEPDHAEAWSLLGQAAAENEEEANAIAALVKAVQLDPYNLDALMMLGVSYTNDLEEHRALNYLKTWLLHHHDYMNNGNIQSIAQQIQEFEQLYGGNVSHGAMLDQNLHDSVINMFLAAVAQKPQDADLHTVLGVLFHISGDFDKAIEAFQEAIRNRPSDPTLWNKLGATQANSSRSADAVHAYKQALSLRPGYVRAMANLAIAYANQQMHSEAIKYYGLTLQMNPNAEHVWSYLKISVSNLKNQQLTQLVNQAAETKNVELLKSILPNPSP